MAKNNFGRKTYAERVFYRGANARDSIWNRAFARGLVNVNDELRQRHMAINP